MAMVSCTGGETTTARRPAELFAWARRTRGRSRRLRSEAHRVNETAIECRSSRRVRAE